MMKRISTGLVGVLMAIHLTGCSLQAVDEDATEKYHKKEALEIDIHVPQHIAKEENTKLEIELSEGDKVITDADEIYAEIWKKDSERVLNLPVEKSSDNKYEIETFFEQDGVYNIKIHASYNNSNIMPTKQFIVGDYEEVEDDDEPEDPHEGHDHHH